MFGSNDDMLDQLWVEKFRPKTTNDLVLHDEQRKFINRCLQKQEIPHLALFGPPGSGKCHDGDEFIDIYIDD